MAEKTPEQGGDPSLTLAKLADSASLSTLLPHLQGMLSVMNRREGNVLQSVKDNISRLQDAFVESMSDILTKEGLDLSQKITLRLDKDQLLKITGEHPDKEKVENILAERPELSVAFREIASQSELLRDMSNIEKLIGARNGISAYQSNSSAAYENSRYQVSIKGEMSHFYFSR
ncbi:MAG: hypothetical protein LBQ63_03355 [Deltaproteobacteria bacterium]|nr:hypothetical protein [Deltaproteobacteria bacterium]